MMEPGEKVPIVRGPPHRAVDRHIREIAAIVIGLILGGLGMLVATARENGATQANIVSMQGQMKETTGDLKTTALLISNLQNVIQSQAVQVATLTVQISTLNAQMTAMLQQRKP